MHNDQSNDRGFTLVELLIVIVILGVLATVTVFAVRGITDQGEQSACDADWKNLESAQEANMAQTGSYATETQLVSNGLLRSESSMVDVTLGSGNYTLAYVGSCAGATATTTPAGPTAPSAIAGFDVAGTWGTGPTEYLVIGFGPGETVTQDFRAYLQTTYQPSTAFTLIFLDTTGAVDSAMVDALDAQPRAVIWGINTTTFDQITTGAYAGQDAPVALAITLGHPQYSLWNEGGGSNLVQSLHGPLTPL